MAHRGYADDLDVCGNCVAAAKLSGKLALLIASPFTGLEANGWT